MKISGFDAMDTAAKQAALMHIKADQTRRKEDYLLALHAMIDQDQQVRLSAKLVCQSFSGQPYFLDLKGLSTEEIRAKIAERFPELQDTGPTLVELPTPDRDFQKLAFELQARAKQAETLNSAWEGRFPKQAQLLNTLRADTQELLTGLLQPEETVDRAYIGFFTEQLGPFRECRRSLDSNAATTLVNLSHVRNPEAVSLVFATLFSLVERPIYLLVLVTGKRLILFLRDQLKHSAAAVHAVPCRMITAVKGHQTPLGYDIELETSQDLLKLPHLEQSDGLELEKILRERSIETIQSSEEFIERDFEKEISRLDLLFQAKTVSPSEYMFRKSRLQKMELEKFSDANVEKLLAKRFSDASLGKKFDEQLLKKFTYERTVMFTDIVGYSKKAAQKELIDTMTLLAVHDKTLMPIISEFQGRLIKKIGDALMVAFEDPVAACRCAIRMQSALIELNRSGSENILIRIGLNTGTVFVKNDDVFGDAVNVAARMESMAQPGMIFLTQATFSRVGQTVPCSDCGEQNVKGQRQPLRIFTIIDESQSASEMRKQAGEFRREMGIAEAPPAVPTTPAAPAEPPIQAAPAAAPQAETPAACVEALRSSVMTALEWYKKGVRLGRPRNSEVEAWFTHFVKDLQNRL